MYRKVVIILFILFILFTIFTCIFVDIYTAAAVFFVIGPMIYSLDDFARFWWNYQKTQRFSKKQSLEVDDV